MSSTYVTCDLEAKSQLIVLVARKYGKTRGVLKDEINQAISNHIEKLKAELKEE